MTFGHQMHAAIALKLAVLIWQASMNQEAEDGTLGETNPLVEEILEPQTLTAMVVLPGLPAKISKPEIRSSLRALTCEGVLATLFYSIIGGVLLSNFLLEVGASPVYIGMLASVGQLVNLLQPVGAYFADKTSSRRRCSWFIFLPSRLLWLIVAAAIWFKDSWDITPNQLVQLTLVIICVTNIMEAFGRASYVSWMAALVPQRLRGRYFGVRNSAVSLVNLIAVPGFGLVVSKWYGGTFAGYGVVLVVGIILGIVSLGCQLLMTDVNPRLEKGGDVETAPVSGKFTAVRCFQNGNFWQFLLYSGLWSFAVNVSAPFFNLFLLSDLGVDVSVVTLYNSLGAGANLLMLIFWGKLADRIGNKPLLIMVGVLVAMTPLLWLLAGTSPVFLWFWFPLLHVLGGATWAAIDLCSTNLLMAVAPVRDRSIYFAIAAAVPGVTGALGIAAGGLGASLVGVSGLSMLFAVSAFLRLLALLPLVKVDEARSMPLLKLWEFFYPASMRPSGQES